MKVTLFPNSFAFEISPARTFALYDVLTRAYEDLVKDGVEVSPDYIASAADTS
jgi:hypothetical protein